MLSMSVTMEGDKVVIERLGRFPEMSQKGVTRALVRIGKGVHRVAFGFLSGAGAKGRIIGEAVHEDGKWKIKNRYTVKQNVASGGYPVPVRTGFLRQALDWLKPGETKAGVADYFTAGPNEVVIYDSALYGNVIHEGKGSSAKFGARRFLTDALERFNGQTPIANIINEEILKEVL
jgi:hypothetical protein